MMVNHVRGESLTGRRFGILEVLEVSSRPIRPKERCWECRCDCGNVVPVTTHQLVGGLKRSCGCAWREHLAEGRARLKHGAARKGATTPEYYTWNTLKERCANPNVEHYDYYGGRGITVCARWARDFAAFLADVGPRPSSRHSIDRIENDLGYWCGNCEECNGRGVTKMNCRWATRSQQMRNARPARRTARASLISYQGESMGMAQWARRMGWPMYVIQNRVRRGWDVDRIFTTPRAR